VGTAREEGRGTAEREILPVTCLISGIDNLL